MFSGFPSGLPGVGLLVLRVVLAGHVITDGVGYATQPAADVAHVAAGGAVILVGMMMIVGLLTPILQSAVAVVAGYSAWRIWWLAPVMTTAVFWSSGIFDAAIAVSIVLLGPGAYSLDARLFGRREVIIRRLPSSTQDAGHHR